MRHVRPSLDDPDILVAGMIAAQVVMWTLAPALTHSALPLDVLEGYAWGREWPIATYKHPAMPSWLLEISRLVTGTTAWPSYLMSQLCVAVSFLCVYLLGRDMMGRERAAAGTLLLAGVAFYAWPTPEFNHNILEMPFWAALPLVAWRAVESRSLAWWLLLGAIGGASLYAKLSATLIVVTTAAWLVCDARARARLATPGPWLALPVFLVVAAPLAIWLVKHDFAPLKYAAVRSALRDLRDLPVFFFNISINIAGLFAIMRVAGLLGRWPGKSPSFPATGSAGPVDDRAKRCLAFFVGGPLLLAVISTALAHKGLRSAWGSSMFHFLGLLAVACTAGRFGPRTLRRIAGCAMALLIIVPVAYAAVVTLSPRFTKAPIRITWPQAEIARRMAEIWAAETRGRPLRIVAGETWIAGLIAVNDKDRPSVLTNWSLEDAPWISPRRLESDGMLVVWEPPKPPRGLQGYLGTRKLSQARFKTSHARRDIVINYIVVPPKSIAD